MPEAVSWATQVPQVSLRHLVARYVGYTQHQAHLTHEWQTPAED